MLPISVCMIAKNEEKYIAECLRRLSAYDWEIVVVDTGSTDRTVEIAKSYTSSVYHFNWINDFSAARNFSISVAKNDCILVVDCDEYLEASDTTLDILSSLPQQLKSTEIGMVNRYSIAASGGCASQVHEQIARIFHRKYTYYEGTIHEQLVSRSGTQPDFVPLQLAFYHVGYSTVELKEQKAMRNISLLEKELTHAPHDPYILFQLGQSYFGLDRYAEALPYFEVALQQDVNEKEDYVQLLIESYGYCLLSLKQYSRALELEGVYSIFSGHGDFVFLMGLIYMNNGLFHKAIEEFLKATTISLYSVEGVCSYKAYYNIGVIYECLGDTRQATSYYQKCGDYPPAQNRLK